MALLARGAIDCVLTRVQLSQLELFDCTGSDEPVLFRANRVTLNSDKFICVQDSETVQVVALGSSATDGMSKTPQRSFSTAGKRRRSTSPGHSPRGSSPNTPQSTTIASLSPEGSAVKASGGRVGIDPQMGGDGGGGGKAAPKRKGEEAFSLGYRIYGRWPIIGGVSVIAQLCDPHESVEEKLEEEAPREGVAGTAEASEPRGGRDNTTASTGTHDPNSESHRYSCAGHGHHSGEGGKEHRWHCVVAVKQGMRIEIFDAKVDKKIRQCVAGEPIQLWKFLGDGLIALVGSRAGVCLSSGGVWGLLSFLSMRRVYRTKGVSR